MFEPSCVDNPEIVPVQGACRVVVVPSVAQHTFKSPSGSTAVNVTVSKLEVYVFPFTGSVIITIGANISSTISVNSAESV